MNIFNPKLSRKSIALISPLLIFLVACGKQNQPQAEATPPVTVEVQNLTADTVEASSEFLGNLEAKQKTLVASRVEGRITEIAVNEGDRVKKGQLLIQLQPTREQEEVNAATSNVNIQKASLSNAEAELKAAEAEVASAVAAVEQSKADLRQQEAEVELAKVNLERVRFLVKQGAQSQQALDNNTRNLNTAQAQRDSASQAVNASQKAVSAAEARVVAARAGVEGEKASLNQASAQVGVAQQNLEFNSITAPIDGVVSQITPKVGDYIEAGQEITSLSQNEVLEVNINVPIERAKDLKLGLPAIIVDRQNETLGKGTVSFISPTVDRNEQAVLVKAAIKNNGNLRDDGFVRAKIIWDRTPGVLIPTTAISRIAGQNFVFVAESSDKAGKPNWIAKQKLVKLGAIQGQAYQVISGVEPGEKLITTGLLNLSDGSPISVDVSQKSTKKEKVISKVTSNE
jgi:RND family efflux transporter MFP subunit